MWRWCWWLWCWAIKCSLQTDCVSSAHTTLFLILRLSLSRKLANNLLSQQLIIIIRRDDAFATLLWTELLGILLVLSVLVLVVLVHYHFLSSISSSCELWTGLVSSSTAVPRQKRQRFVGYMMLIIPTLS